MPIAPLAAAMVPVLFAYGGWQTASFVSGEMREPRRDLPARLLIGVLGVVVLYVAVNVVCLHVLGARRTGGDDDAGIGGDASRAGRGRRAAHRRRHRRIDGRLSQPGNADGTAGVLRDGARRCVLQGRSRTWAHGRAHRWWRLPCRASGHR